MIELFPDLSRGFRTKARFEVKRIMKASNDARDCAQQLIDFMNTLSSTEEKQYVDLLVRIELEKLKDESDSN